MSLAAKCPILVAALLLAFPVAAEQKPYTMQDLQALNQRQAWNELIWHLQDVPAASRSTEWNRMVENACLRENIESDYAEYCYQELTSVLNSEPANRDFAMKAGKWARLNQQHWTAIPFFAKAITAPGDARCKDADVSMAVVSGLGLPADSNKEVVAKTKTLAFQTCWPEVKDAVLNAFNDDAYLRANSCPDLKKKGVLKGLRLSRCSE